MCQSHWPQQRIVSCKLPQDNKTSTILPGTVRIIEDRFYVKRLHHASGMCHLGRQGSFHWDLILVPHSCHISNTPTSNNSSCMSMLNVHTSSPIPRPSPPPVFDCFRVCKNGGRRRGECYHVIWGTGFTCHHVYMYYGEDRSCVLY